MNKSNHGKKVLKQSIVLLGMMGAGKTSVGRALAGLLEVPFFDSDAEIEAIAGCSVPTIFAQYGEPEFRRMERQVIARLLQGDLCVLSLGGGAFVDTETRAHVKETACSVWLKGDPELLFERVMRQGGRPLLECENPHEKLVGLLATREPIYAQADITVLCDNRPVAVTAGRVRDAVIQAA